MKKVFEFTPPPEEPAEVGLGAGREGFCIAVLLHTARWFTKVRWAIGLLFLLAGAGAWLLQAPLERVGLVLPRRWLWDFAAVLIVANAGFCLATRLLAPQSPKRWVDLNIWSQVVVDLLVLTALVHLVGSTSTFVPFAYLFHVTLSAVSFSPRLSLGVAVLAAVLYLGCIGLEMSGVLPPRCVLAGDACVCERSATVKVLFAGPAVFVWFSVWYLVSTLAGTVRERNRQLDLANGRLLDADAEKNRRVLRVTHDLKAPFAGIESSIQALRSECWNELPESARRTIVKIEARSATLRARIGDSLTLGALRATNGGGEAREPVAVRQLLSDAAFQVQGLALARNVTVGVDAEDVAFDSDAHQLSILVLNLVSNAVCYSRDGGSVEVTARAGDEGVTVRVADHGIGISEDALPHIFEDYYRAKEASRFNPQSTGLGLAIVRQVAQNLRLTLTVFSEPGQGTAIDVLIPNRTPGCGGVRRRAGFVVGA